MGEDAAQQIIGAFVDGMVAGRSLPLLQPSGRSLNCTVQIDRNRTALHIRMQSGKPRRVPLETILQISVGAESADDLKMPLHDYCVTLLLEDEKTIFAFEFTDDEARDTFALCLGMFVDQRRAEVEDEEEEETQPQPQPQPQQQQPARPPPQGLPQAPRPAAGGHAYKTKDFWSPTWCSICNNFLSGVKEQGQECQGCKQVACHNCAARGGHCTAARGSPPAAASSPPDRKPAPAPAPTSYPAAKASVPPAPAGYPAMSSARGAPAGLEDFLDEAGCDSARSASSQPKGKKELTDGQKLIKRFVQKMVKGRELHMLSTTGRSLLCLVTIDRDIRNISIQLAHKKDAKQRFIPLKSIEEICVGTEVADDIELPVDDLSVTLVLDEGQAIAFELDDEESRDTFAMCMGMFVDGNRKDAEKRRKRKS